MTNRQSLNEIEQHVLEHIDVEAMLAYLDRLVAIPSLSGQETAAQESVASQMEGQGLAVDRLRWSGIGAWALWGTWGKVWVHP